MPGAGLAIRIDAMRPDDWNAVRAIYEEGLATGRATFEVKAPAWEEWDQNHLPYCRLVARQMGAGGEQVIGWAALSPISRRQVYAGVVEVSIYVSASARGQGLGRALLSALVRDSETAGIWTLQATIMAVNTASLALHRACGFRVVGRRERIAQRDGIWHDTLILERRSPVVGV